MKYPILILIITTLTISCERFKGGVNKAGEKAGEVIGEAAEGVARGVENAFELKIEKKDSVKLKAIDFGKITVDSGPDATDNKLIVYIIFTEDFSGEIMLKVFDKKRSEIGRVRKTIQGKKDVATYFEFIFDPHTNIDRDCLIVME